ncbi:uncharacterized protein LOC108111260 [Drosophila eugracilis]|uniref:uncharacterized protein LOC108111260 n=1 Tax=Drosophila eugracilis TaxID=29029 RepID=UPI001BD99FF1|nr:uncharacterized protein LOC108111260 [Drosophila eugracilis]
MVKSLTFLIAVLAIADNLGWEWMGDAAGTDLSSSSAQTQGCECSATMSCSCCQSVAVSLMNETSTLCLTLGIGLQSGTLDLGASLDGTSVGSFSISTNKPPTYCVPVVSLVSLDICLKVDIQMAGVAVKACPTFYTNYSSNQVVAYDFPCIQVGLNGVSLV